MSDVEGLRLADVIVLADGGGFGESGQSVSEILRKVSCGGAIEDTKGVRSKAKSEELLWEIYI